LGIDGWRLDVAFCVAHAFWKKWSYYVKSLNPEAYLTAEVIDEAYKLKPYLQGDEFDAVMNYPFAFEGSEFFINDKNRLSVPEFQERMTALVDVFGYERFLSQQNLFGSHDANRIASHIVNRNFARYGDWGDYFSKSKASNPAYNTRKPLPEERRIQLLWTVFQMTFPGAPMLYYGDEVGMWGANDPDCRKPMMWGDSTFQPEFYKPDQSIYEEPNFVNFDSLIFSQNKSLIELRKSMPNLKFGTFNWIKIPIYYTRNSFERSFNYLNNNRPKILFFERKLKTKCIVAINVFGMPMGFKTKYLFDVAFDPLTQKKYFGNQDIFWLAPFDFQIFVIEN